MKFSTSIVAALMFAVAGVTSAQVDAGKAKGADKAAAKAAAPKKADSPTVLNDSAKGSASASGAKAAPKGGKGNGYAEYEERGQKRAHK